MLTEAPPSEAPPSQAPPSKAPPSESSLSSLGSGAEGPEEELEFVLKPPRGLKGYVSSLSAQRSAVQSDLKKIEWRQKIGLASNRLRESASGALEEEP